MNRRTEFGILLERCRKSSRLSQRQLGELAEIDRSYVNRLENGNRRPSRKTVLSLAKALDIGERDGRYDSLLNAAGFLSNGFSRYFASENIYDLNQLYKRSTSDTQKEIDASIRLISEAVLHRNVSLRISEIEFEEGVQ